MLAFASHQIEVSQKILEQLYQSLTTLDVKKVAAGFAGKNQKMLLNIAIDLIAENGDELQYYLYQRKAIIAEDMWLTLESNGAINFNSAYGLTTGLAINITTLFEQLGSVTLADISTDGILVVNSGINMDKKMMRQIILNNALLKIYATGSLIATDSENKFGDVNIGLIMDNALQGASIDINLGAVIVHIKTPIQNLPNIINIDELVFNDYTLEGMTITNASNVSDTAVIAPTYTHSLNLIDTLGVEISPAFNLIDQQTNKCITDYRQGAVALLDECDNNNLYQKWQWHNNHIYSVENGQRTDKCLIASKNNLSLNHCDTANDVAKTWHWKNNQLHSNLDTGVCMGIKDISLLTSVDCNSGSPRYWRPAF
jgi:hypothetical protein